jgi:hypothetical protein
MSLKKNWPAVYAGVEQLFSDPPDNVAFETSETVDLTGGLVETRRHTVCHKVAVTHAAHNAHHGAGETDLDHRYRNLSV